MAMIECKECKTQISEQAQDCPKCGAKVSKKTSFITWLAGAVAALGVGSCVVGMNQSEPGRELAQAKKASIEASKSPAQKAAEAAAEKHRNIEFKFSVMAAQMVKAGTKNPSSFELVDANLVEYGALCLVYRGTNSFNAVVTSNIAITRKFTIGSWNKDCAGKDAVGMRHIKQAL